MNPSQLQSLAAVHTILNMVSISISSVILNNVNVWLTSVWDMLWQNMTRPYHSILIFSFSKENPYYPSNNAFLFLCSVCWWLSIISMSKVFQHLKLPYQKWLSVLIPILSWVSIVGLFCVILLIFQLNNNKTGEHVLLNLCQLIYRIIRTLLWS